MNWLDPFVNGLSAITAILFPALTPEPDSRKAGWSISEATLTRQDMVEDDTP